MSSHIKIAQNFLNQQKLDCIIVSNLRNLRYISGFTGSSGTVVILKNKVVLLTDFRYVEQAKVQAKDCKIMQHGANVYEDIKKLIVDCHSVGFEANYTTVENFFKLSEQFKSKDLKAIKLDQLRIIKDKTELKHIQKAVDIADLAFSQLIQELKVNMTEFQAAALLEYYMRINGAEGTSFSTIVASGERSSLPHGQPTDKIIKKGDLVTFDFGALYNGYCSDMTRTVVMGKANKKQKEIYNIVLNAQLATIENLKSGITGKQGDAYARDIIKNAGFGDMFGHGTGHSLGLAIHEEPRLSPSCDTILQPNMVLTVEPGVYIPGWGGVRIEDVVVITKTGVKILTTSDKTLLELSN